MSNRNKTAVVVKTSGPATVKVTVRQEKKSPAQKQGLKFGQGNSKLDDAVFTFSLPAGHFCPFADKCLAKTDRETGRVKDGPNTQFRCFAASGETYASVRNARWHNADLL